MMTLFDIPKPCTSVYARACPNHGMCVCSVKVVNDQHFLDESDCPLHNQFSPHLDPQAWRDSRSPRLVHLRRSGDTGG